MYNRPHTGRSARGNPPLQRNRKKILDANQFEISAPKQRIRSPAGNGDVLDFVHKNIRMSHGTLSNILDSDNLPTVFHILDHFNIKNLSEPIKKFTDWDRAQSLASELISSKVEINSSVEADKAARDFTASIASARRLSTRKITLLDINNDLPRLDRLLKHKHRLRKMWQETRDPACKTEVNWITKQIRRMARKKALERWGTKISNCGMVWYHPPLLNLPGEEGAVTFLCVQYAVNVVCLLRITHMTMRVFHLRYTPFIVPSTSPSRVGA
jgi:hypothetical protein